MRTTIIIEKKMLQDLMAESCRKTKSSALRGAITHYLKQKKIEKIKQQKGAVKFDMTAEELRHPEIGNVGGR
ncbi:MAG: hypothetical protein OEW15_07300 [Nitrospirota bacterium]|nr:hypothetical protein [Nitrospirota bacterium]